MGNSQRVREEIKLIYNEFSNRDGNKVYLVGYGDARDKKTGEPSARSWFSAKRVGARSIALWEQGPQHLREAWLKQESHRAARLDGKKAKTEARGTGNKETTEVQGAVKKAGEELDKEAKLEELEAARKAATASSFARTHATSSASSAIATVEFPAEVPKKRGRGRPRKIRSPPQIASPNPTTPFDTTQRAPRSFTRTTSAPRGPSPQVRPTQHSRESLEGALYFSQATPAASNQNTAPTSFPSPLRATSSFRDTGIVPESEPEDELDLQPSASYVPTTQDTVGTSQSASSPQRQPNPSTYEVMKITTSTAIYLLTHHSQSTAVFTPQEEQPPSPSPSIPETEPEVDSTPQHELVEETFFEIDHEAQQQLESQQEIPDTFETGHTLSTLEGPFVHEASHSTQEKLADATTGSSVRTVLSTTQDEHPIASRTASSQRSEQRHNVLTSQTDSTHTSTDSSRQGPVQSDPHLGFETSSGLVVTHSQPFSTQEQHAQIPVSDPISSTQEQHSESIPARSERQSNSLHHLLHHEPSQEPSSLSHTSVEDPSPVPAPPRQSPGTLETNGDAPPRLETPRSSDFLSVVMNTEQVKGEPVDPEHDRILKEVEAAKLQRIEARKKRLALEAEKQEEKPEENSSFAQSNALEKTRNLEQLVASEAGTRSPSTIPDRLPAPRQATSLRTVATSTPASMRLAAQDTSSHLVNYEAEATSIGPEDVDMHDLQQSDDSDDESILNDELGLQEQEYIVPLEIHGRQADEYRRVSKELSELRASLIRDSQDAQSKIESIFKRLRGLETHLELMQGRNQATQPNDDQSAHDKRAAQNTLSESVKFRFLHALLLKLQARDLHVIILIEDEENTRLFEIVESFLRGAGFSFESPTTGHIHAATEGPGNEKELLETTILGSTSSRVLREAHLIVCLDGRQQATEIRKKQWARKADGSSVPMLHLVIPRTIGHIDLYLSTRPNAQKRLENMIATLSQFYHQGNIGHAFDDVRLDRSFYIDFADQVVSFLLPSQDEPALSEWPLPAIGSIKDDIEYLSQRSLDAEGPVSPVLGSNAAGKRPLLQVDDRDDPAKKMRFTPQPPAHASTSHVSDSAPGASSSAEQRSHWWKQEALRKDDVLKDFTARQGLYEKTREANRALQDDVERLSAKISELEAQNVRAREQLSLKVSDNVELLKENKGLREANLSSDDEKIRRISELEEKLAQAEKEKNTAVASKKSTESTLDYVKEQRQTLQTECTAMAQNLEEVQKELAKWKRAEHAQTLLPAFHERQAKQQSNQVALLKEKLTTAERLLEGKTRQYEKLKAENERVRMTRGVGGGTRAASVGARTPRPGSRAASPLPNGRDRVANLRNG